MRACSQSSNLATCLRPYRTHHFILCRPIKASSASVPRHSFADNSWRKTSGVLSMYVSIDRSGHVLRTCPLIRITPASMILCARASDEMAVQARQGEDHEVPVQAETWFTFGVQHQGWTSVSDPGPTQTLENLATKAIEPEFPPGLAKGTEVKCAKVSVWMEASTESRILTMCRRRSSWPDTELPGIPPALPSISPE